jgi:hypothetical protein
MALTTNQAAQMTILTNQITEMKQIVMGSGQCTMAGMGNYFFEAFKQLEIQAKKVTTA